MFHSTKSNTDVSSGAVARNGCECGAIFWWYCDSWRGELALCRQILATRSRLRRVVGHRIIAGVEHPARLGGEIHPRRAEDVDQLIALLADRTRGMDRGRRDHGDRRRAAIFVVVLTPVVHVRGPRPANVVNVGPFERERALLEVVVKMRRQFRDVARTDTQIEIVDHEGRASEDASEATAVLLHVEAIGSDAVAVRRCGPRLER